MSRSLDGLDIERKKARARLERKLAEQRAYRDELHADTRTWNAAKKRARIERVDEMIAGLEVQLQEFNAVTGDGSGHSPAL